MAWPKVIELTETDPFLRGCHHGEECREGIEILLDAWKRHLGQHFSRFGGWLRYQLTRRLYHWLFAASIPRRFKEEMLGVAFGANCRYGDVALVNCFDDAFRILFQRGCPGLSPTAERFRENWPVPNLHCSSFGAMTVRNAILYGSNLDEGVFERELCRLVTVFRYRFHGELPDLASVLVPGYIGVMRGMNDRGIFAAHHTAHTADARWPRIPQGILLRMALEKTNLDSACSVITERFRTIGSNVLIGDSQDARVLELSAKHHAVRPLAGSSIVCTNHFLTEKMNAYYRPEHIVPGMGLPDFLVDPKYTRWRFDRIKGILDRSTPQIPESVCRILLEVSNDMTVQSSIWDPADKSFWLALPRSGFPPAPRDCELHQVRL